MAILTLPRRDQIERLCAAFGLGALESFEGIPAGTVNSSYALELSSGRFFLRIYEEQDKDGARAEARLLTHLAARGVRTPAPIADENGACVHVICGKPAAIFPWRAGTMRCQRAVTPEDARRVGEALGRLHVAGEGAELAAGRFRVEDLVERTARIAGLADPVLSREAAPLRAGLEKWDAARRKGLPGGLVHGDLFRDNVLWEGAEISALLDFESASAGTFAYDVMVTVLAWCFGGGFEAGLARALSSGYGKVRELSEQEREGLLAEGCFAAVRFAITRITDDAIRVGKDWRRFAMRREVLESLGSAGLREAMGL